MSTFPLVLETTITTALLATAPQPAPRPQASTIMVLGVGSESELSPLAESAKCIVYQEITNDDKSESESALTAALSHNVQFHSNPKIFHQTPKGCDASALPQFALNLERGLIWEVLASDNIQARIVPESLKLTERKLRAEYFATALSGETFVPFPVCAPDGCANFHLALLSKWEHLIASTQNAFGLSASVDEALIAALADGHSEKLSPRPDSPLAGLCKEAPVQIQYARKMDKWTAFCNAENGTQALDLEQPSWIFTLNKRCKNVQFQVGFQFSPNSVFLYGNGERSELPPFESSNCSKSGSEYQIESWIPANHNNITAPPELPTFAGCQSPDTITSLLQLKVLAKARGRDLTSIIVTFSQPVPKWLNFEVYFPAIHPKLRCTRKIVNNEVQTLECGAKTGATIDILDAPNSIQIISPIGVCQ